MGRDIFRKTAVLVIGSSGKSLLFFPGKREIEANGI
jgi:hypothetical protein